MERDIENLVIPQHVALILDGNGRWAKKRGLPRTVVMDTMVGSIRGLGYSILPTLVSLTGACGLRVIWIFTIFAAQRSLAILYLSYPISWAVTATAHMICFWRAAKKMPKEDGHPVRG